MLSSVEFHIIDKESSPYTFFLASMAHTNLDTRFIVVKDGVSIIIIKDKFLRVIFKPRIYL